MKQVFDVTKKMVRDHREISEISVINWQQSSWKRTTLQKDGAVQLSAAKAHVFSDSVSWTERREHMEGENRMVYGHEDRGEMTVFHDPRRCGTGQFEWLMSRAHITSTQHIIQSERMDPWEHEDRSSLGGSWQLPSRPLLNRDHDPLFFLDDGTCS